MMSNTSLASLLPDSRYDDDSIDDDDPMIQTNLRGSTAETNTVIVNRTRGRKNFVIIGIIIICIVLLIGSLTFAMIIIRTKKQQFQSSSTTLPTTHFLTDKSRNSSKKFSHQIFSVKLN